MNTMTVKHRYSECIRGRLSVSAGVCCVAVRSPIRGARQGEL